MFIQRSGWLAAATLSLLLSSSNAQTITVDGETISMLLPYVTFGLLPFLPIGLSNVNWGFSGCYERAIY